MGECDYCHAAGDTIFAKGTGANLYWYLQTDVAQKCVDWGLGYGNSPGWGSNNSSLVSNQWNHIVVTQKNINTTTTTPNFYINGIPKNSYSFSVTPTGSIATDNSAGNFANPFNGTILYVRYWNRVLTQREVWTLYTNPFIIYKHPNYSTEWLSSGSTPYAWQGIISQPIITNDVMMV